MNTVPYRYFKDELSNGLRVITLEMPYMHAAEVALYIRAGSRYETIDNNGLSHFLEHMFFRGSRAFPSSFKLNQAFEMMGDGLIANTFREFTCFWSKIDPKFLDRGVHLFGDVFGSPIFEEMETERKIVNIELLEDFDSGGEPLDIDDISRPFLWPGHSLGFSVIGTQENIQKFTREDVVSHYEKHFKAANMVLCVTGRVARHEVLEAAQKYFGSLPTGTLIYPSPLLMSQEFPLSKFIYADASKIDIQLSFRAYGETHPRIKTLYLIQRALDDGISSRLQRSICEEKGLAYDISAALDCYSDIGVFDIDVSVPSDKAYSVLLAILEELKLLKEKGIEQEEFEKIRRRAVREYEFHFDHLRQMSIHFGEGELLYGLKTPEECMHEINQIKLEDIQQCSEEVFDSKNFNLVVLGPYTLQQHKDMKELLRSQPV